jgi:adenylate cyclase
MAAAAVRGSLRTLRQIGPVRLLVTLALVVGGLLVARYAWELPLISDGERALYDIRAIEQMPVARQSDRVTLVTYTDDTLRLLRKRSPLDRAMLARALQALDRLEPRAIGIDILIDQEQDEDEQLLAALRGMRTPTYVAFAEPETNEGSIDSEQADFLRNFLAQATANPRVRPASIRLEGDLADNVMRRWPTHPPQLPPLLAAAMMPENQAFRSYEGQIEFRRTASEEETAFAEIPIETLAPVLDAELDEAGRQALMDELLPALRPQIAGRYILIGGDINDVDDKSVPLSRRTGQPMKGLEVHAQMLAQMIDNDLPSPIAPWLLWAAAAIVVLAGAITGMFELRSIWLMLALIVQLALIAYLPFLLAGQNVATVDLPAAGWGAGWLLAFIGVGIAARAVGAEQRNFAQSALGKYLPPDVAAEIMRDPDQLALTGERKEIYALFTDLEGFTKLSHAIEPEQLSVLLNRYLDELSDTVLEHGGTIDKFIGDAVVAFWGAPIAREDDADRAVLAAVAMYQAGEEFRRSADPSLPPIGCTRVGLHRGEAVVGNFGGERRIQYTALGDGMNTAARLESANKALKTTILVSGEVVKQSSLDLFRPMGRIVLSGRATPIEVWEPVPQMDGDLRWQLRTLWERYDSGDKSALSLVERVAAEHPEDAALQNFVYRIREAGPGGHFVLGSK